MKKKESHPSPQKKRSPAAPEVKGILTLSTSIIMILSLLSFTDGDASNNSLGLLGFTFAWIFQYFFGLGSYLIVFYLICLSYRLLKGQIIQAPLSNFLYFTLILSCTCILLCIIAEIKPQFAQLASPLVYSNVVTTNTSIPYHVLRHNLGGVPFYYIYLDLPIANLKYLLSNLGTSLVCITGIIIGTMMITKIRFNSFFSCQKLLKQLYNLSSGLKFLFSFKQQENSKPLEGIGIPKQQENSIPIKKHPRDLPIKINSQRSFSSVQEGSPPQQETTKHLSPKESSIVNNFQIPSHVILSSCKTVDQPALKKHLHRQAEILESTLQSFSIEAKVGEINCGPTITSFEVHPSIGVKVQKIKALENDLALNLEAQSIRIIAPIPGKAAVGIEVPNLHPQEVSFKEMLNTYKQAPKNYAIPILLGKTVLGNHVTADLTKMPHCIIAGATGSGKSVCINTIIVSILMNMNPDQVKILMIDPKKVELTPYTRLPHMLAPVITEPSSACTALNWLVKEMELRYEILKQVGQRNISAFNQRKIDNEHENSLDIPIPKRMSYIVGIIDELADLMMVSSSDIETPIARIAQMARAVGIHLILATQRPSREVITGLIKANFPTRIAFKVASRVNSQIILDESGAESLLGNGDMLFLPPGASSVIRSQGAYIRDEDINRVINSICKQAPPNYLIKSFDKLHSDDHLNVENDEQLDKFYEQARELVIKTGNASTTFLQRKLKIGYARAAGLMDQLEDKGIVGPQEGSKPRVVFYKNEKQ